ncbi:hypothetical protein ABID21_001143 [Pseudorhizobium tarimense]|uniref:Tripartite ATP-independent transporter, DctQ component n=1 Tax=Pseudorhizobium tarimense TaxID=1079109 RepID=A0ABV2H3C1_9HYPH
MMLLLHFLVDPLSQSLDFFRLIVDDLLRGGLGLFIFAVLQLDLRHVDCTEMMRDQAADEGDVGMSFIIPCIICWFIDIMASIEALWQSVTSAIGP